MLFLVLGDCNGVIWVGWGVVWIYEHKENPSSTTQEINGKEKEKERAQVRVRENREEGGGRRTEGDNEGKATVRFSNQYRH